MQNGVDGETIHDTLSDTSQSPMGDVTSLTGELIHEHFSHKHVCGIFDSDFSRVQVLVA